MSRLVLFLDVDGVLNTKQCRNQNVSLAPDCVSVLHRFLEGFNEYEVEIILASFWKASFYGAHDERNSTRVKMLESALAPYTITGKVSEPRSRGIAEYLSEHTLSEGDQMLILDDSHEIYDQDLMKCLYVTQDGLKDNDISGMKSRVTEIHASCHSRFND